jgi:hypothetical protein
MTITLNGTTGITTPALDSVAPFSSADMPAGSVLQVVQGTYATSGSTTSTSWTATGLAATITPSSASSKIMVIVSCPVQTNSLGTYSAKYTVFRGTTSGTELSSTGAGFGNLVVIAQAYVATTFSITYLDAPSTTSSQTYTFAARSEGNSSYAGVCNGNTVGTITLMEIAG